MFNHLQSMVNEGSVEPCHGLHYLQMATEKLAKAFFLAWGPIKKRHNYFSKFWRALRTRNGFAEPYDMQILSRFATIC